MIERMLSRGTVCGTVQEKVGPRVFVKRRLEKMDVSIFS